MKIGVIFFHKNILNIYKKSWIQKSVNSMLSQSINDFSIYEINYGWDDYSVLSDIDHNKKSFFFSEKFENHVYAMNFILDQAFSDGCDCVFNTNLDDFYHPTRIEKQIECIRKGNDIVSSDFCYVEEFTEGDRVVFHKNILQFGDIESNLIRNHNVIAHPCVAYSRKFWSDGNRYNVDTIPREDLLLWQSALQKGYSLFIHPEELLYYRLHGNQITGNNRLYT